MSSTDALFTRFEGLFKKYLQRPLIVGFALPVSLRLEPTKGDLLRQFFFHSWDKKELPSKELLMEVVRFLGPPPIHRFEEVEDRVAESFALALEKLEIEEHGEEASLPQKSRQKSKPGRKADPKIQKRRETVQKYIHTYIDWFDPSSKEQLLDEFDDEDIPLPKSKSVPESVDIWAKFIDYPDDWQRVVNKVLNRDRWR